MLYVKSSGVSEYGVWIVGKLITSTIEINSIFKTNLKEKPTNDKLEIKKLLISNSKNGIKFSVEI